MATEYLEEVKYFWRIVDSESILTAELFSFPHLQHEDILVWVMSSVTCWALKVLGDSWSLFTSLSFLHLSCAVVNVELWALINIINECY